MSFYDGNSMMVFWAGLPSRVHKLLKLQNRSLEVSVQRFLIPKSGWKFLRTKTLVRMMLDYILFP
jgi:hypothetical protein